MGQFISLLEKPKLHNPSFVAAWPGMGRVAVLAIGYLKERLGAKLLGEVVPTDFFAPTGAIVTKQMVVPPEPPKNEFFYYKAPASGRDILFFIGTAQPIPHREYSFATEILKVAESFNVKIVYTAAAAPSDMHFKDVPRVFAVPNHPDLLKKVMEYKIHYMGEGNIAGLNGLLVSVAAEKKIQGMCLLGEIPFFTAQVEYPRAAFAVLSVLTEMLGVKIDMMDLELYADQKDKEIEPLAALLTRGEHKAEESRSEDGFVPQQEEKVPKSVRVKIEKLFRQAEFDRTYKSKMKLKEELDKWELFEEYLDRFLDLFKKPHGES
jgi:proteasome assembly chaperone (PAC2) family protein